MFTDSYGKDWYENTTSLDTNDVNWNYYNPLEENSNLYIVCQTCGEHLYDGEYYYPELNVCEYCIDKYRQTVNIDL